MIDLEEVHLALRSVLESIAELPTLRAWENVDFSPSATEPSISEEMGSTMQRRLTAPAAASTLEVTGLYIVKLFGIAGGGDAAIREVQQAILDAFPLGGTVILDTGDTVRVEGDAGYQVSQILPIDGGKSQCTITIPWLCYLRNTSSLALAS